MVSIRHIYVPNHSHLDVFLTAEFQRVVTLWSFRNKAKAAEIHTNLDFGGERLALIPIEEPIVIAGAYERYGIGAYKNGCTLWERKDLKKVQFMTNLLIGNEHYVGAGFEDKSFVLLHPYDGSTVSTLKGVREVYTNVDGAYWIVQTNTRWKLINSATNTEIWSERGNVAGVCFSKTKILLNFGEFISCIDFHGNETWNCNVQESHIIHEVAWNEARQVWHYLMWNHLDGGPKLLCTVDAAGLFISKFELGEIWEYTFSNDGARLITSEGEILDTNDLAVVWKFCHR